MIADRAARRAEECAFDNEAWYDALRDVTFPSDFFDLPQDQGVALVAAYKHRFTSRAPPSPAQWAALRTLQANLDSAIAGVAEDDGGAFVRLSTRSPKDAVCLPDDGTAERLQADAATDPNGALAAFFQTSNESLRVGSGAEALQLLLCSERVFMDLLTEREAAGAGQPWRMRVCVRRWNPHLRDQLEFRGFVRHGKLVALGQYNTYVALVRLHDERAALLAQMTAFFDAQLEHRLAAAGINSCVLDLACLPEPAGTTLVVELNPANKSTGAGLFDWVRDAELLLTGPPPAGEPVDFRLVPLPPPVGGATAEQTDEQKQDRERQASLLEVLLDQAAETRRYRQAPPAPELQPPPPRVCVVS